VNHQDIIEEVYGKNLNKHIKAMPNAEEMDKFSENYTYKRAEVNSKLAKATLIKI
jgi:hypothetical protein